MAVCAASVHKLKTVEYVWDLQLILGMQGYGE